MRTAGPLGSVAADTELRRNARVVERRTGTSLRRALATEGADDASDHVNSIELSLSVNLTDDACVVRAHPSGTDTMNAPAGERYGTNWVSSGMSPGGLLSVGTGASTGTGDALREGWDERSAGEGVRVERVETVGPPARDTGPAFVHPATNAALAAMAAIHLTYGRIMCVPRSATTIALLCPQMIRHQR
jgi:hypothetical protein